MGNIFIAVDHKENQRLLTELLSQYHTITLADAPESLNQSFDLGVFDGHAFHRLWKNVHRRKEAAAPLFLPILFITPRQDINLLTRQMWRVFDEIIFSPIEKTELLIRVEVLLRSRRLSLELEGKNLQLQQEINAHKDTSQDLQESDERFRIALQNSPLIVSHSDLDLRYTWIYNAPHIFDNQDVVGKRDDELLPGAGSAALIELKRQVLERGVGTRAEVELQLGSELKIYDVTIEPIFDKTGKCAGVTTSAFDITERKAVEEKALEVAAMEERQRLARDLHDSVTQTLFSLVLQADSLPYTLEKDAQKAKSQAEMLRRMAQGAMAEMRTLFLELRPKNIIKSSLNDLFEQLIRAVQARRLIDISYTVELDSPLSEDAHIALYRIVQEALNNMVKHSQASKGHISLIANQGQLELRIRDNGLGFDAEKLSAGLGLGVMRERALIIGAVLEVVSNEGAGTEVILSAALVSPP